LVFDVDSNHLVDGLLALAGGRAGNGVLEPNFDEQNDGLPVTVEEVGQVFLGQKFQGNCSSREVLTKTENPIR
jgi:hypothetical protein